MNWSKIKSIMICFLLGMNIFMLGFTAFTTYKENNLPKEVVSASVNLLKEHSLSCSESVFPTYVSSLPVLSAEFFSASELSDMFFGKQIPFRTVEDSLVAEDNYQTLTVKDNFFSFESGLSEEKSTKAKKLRALKKLGIDMSGSTYDEKNGYFYKMYKNTNLFDMYIKIELDSDMDIASVKAQWPQKLKPTRSVISFSIAPYVTDIWKNFESGKITDIEPGYKLLRHGESFVFKPAWRITANGKSKIF